MSREIKSYTVPLTPQLASEFATLPKLHGERPIRRDRRLRLEAAIQNGTFHSPNWRVAWIGGVKYRIDGQASSTILSESNGSFPRNLMAHITEFECDSELDAAELFSQFDAPWSARTSGEVTGAHAGIHPELRDMARRRIEVCVAGIWAAMSEGGDRSKKTTSDDRARLVHDYKEFIIWAQEFSAVRILERSASMAIIFKSWRLNREAAADFWGLVRDNSHPDVGNPSRRLHDVLTECTLRNPGPNMQVNRNFKWGHRAIMAKCVHAWNAWRRGVKTDLKYYAESAMPELV